MELKRILARDTRAATEKAIALYGPDVLVISNHRIQGETELVVAVDLPADPLEESLAETSTHSIEAPSAPGFKQQFSAAQGKPSPTKEATETPHEANARDYLRSREIVELVREELAGLRREFRLGQQTLPWRSNLNLNPELESLTQSLYQAQIPQALLALLLDSIKDLNDPQLALQTLRTELSHALARQASSAPAPTAGCHVMAGPSGSGKTNMAARLIHNALSGGLTPPLSSSQIALIAFQDTRAGAWSQTQMLSAQLGVDCYRAPTLEILQVVLGELSDKSLVIIDTPGIQMAERLNQIRAALPDIQCHAVLPADATLATFERVLKNPDLRWDSLFLSKLDEAAPPWPLLQFLSDNSALISGCSTGDQLSDWIPDFSLQHLLDMALSPLLTTSLPSAPVTAPARMPLATAETMGIAPSEAPMQAFGWR